MFNSVSEFVYRHRRKFFVTGLVVGGAALGFRYTQHKLIQWQEREAIDFLGQLRHQNHYESTEKTCNKTILSLASTLYEKFVNIVDVDGHVQKLKDGVTDKIAVWEELKIISFTKVALMLYCGSMLTITLRIQLNILGGYLFQDSTGFTEVNKSKLNMEVQQKYLSLCQYFLDMGVKELCSLIEAKVRFVLEGTSLKQNMSLQDIEHIFWAIQSSVSNDCQNPIKNFVKYMLPPGAEYNKNEEELYQMIVNDTVELLQSDEVTSLASSCISQGFSSLIDQIAEHFAEKKVVTIHDQCRLNEDIGFVHPSKVTIPMVKLIPIISSIMNKHKGVQSSEWIIPFVQMDKIKTLGANIYEAFSNPNPICIVGEQCSLNVLIKF